MKNITNRTLALALSGLVLTAAIYAPAQDWSQWRGSNRDAKAPDFKAPKTWPKELTQKWKVAVGEGVATPALVGDKLYVFSRQEGNEIVRCLNVADGKELWQDKYESLGATGPAGQFSGPRSSPTVANGKVVTLGVRGMLSCVDAATGKVLWRKDDFKAWPGFFVSSSPIIVNGLCIAQQGGRENGSIVAYDLGTGEQKWKWSGASPSYASPVLMTFGGTKLIVANTERTTMAVNVADGKLVWEAAAAAPAGPGGGGGGRGGGRDYKASTPVVDGQTIIMAGSGVKAVKLEKEGDKFVGKELWANAEKSVSFNSPVLKNGLLYGLGGNNELFCVNARDGKIAWSAPFPGNTPARAAINFPAFAPAFAGLPAPADPAAPGNPGRPGGPGGPGGQGPGGQGGPPGGQGGPGGRRGGGGGMGGGGFGSLVDAGSVLLALTPSAQLIVIDPGDKEFKQVASYKVAEAATHAYPVVSGNRIFIKDKDSVTLWTVE